MKTRGLFETLTDMARQKRVSFHVPGNKFGRGLSEVLAAQDLRLEELDFTEIEGTDNLHAPEGVIQVAQVHAAEVFGALETQFLVGGTTSGNLAAVMGTVPRGSKLILPRDAHKSVHSAVLLGGVVPVYVLPEMDRITGLSLGISEAGARKALSEHPDAAAVLVTYPNYEGVTSPLSAILKEAHSRGLPVIVDEAHGAHLGLSEALPPTALSLGADVVVQSTHKTLTSLTQSSMLHYGTARGLSLKPRIAGFLGMIQSTSPSYPLMVSLELAVRYYESTGRQAMVALLAQVSEVSAKARSLGFDLMHDLMALPAGYGLDPTRLLIGGRRLCLDGYGLCDELARAGIISEYATSEAVVLIPSIASTREDFARLAQALEAIASSRATRPLKTYTQPVVPVHAPLPLQVLSPEAAFWAPKERIPFAEALGRIAGDFLTPYPPGIPLLVPGERVSEEVQRIVLKELGIQHKVSGLQEGTFTVLKSM